MGTDRPGQSHGARLESLNIWASGPTCLNFALGLANYVAGFGS